MKLPTSLDILGKDVPIVFTDNLPDTKLADTDGDTIWISNDAKKKELKTIMLHEMWHCYIRRSGIFQTNHSTETEEIESDGFANIIEDNFILTAKRRN